MNRVRFKGKVHAFIAYDAVAVILKSNEEDLKNIKKELITKALNIGLMINERKTKYMVMTRGKQLDQN